MWSYISKAMKYLEFKTVRHLQKKCSVCKEKASRFQDAPGQGREWFCADDFKEQQNTNGNS
jgi:hypothetical protein